MVYINKNMVINQLQEVIENSFEKKVANLPKSFQQQQLQAIEILKKSILYEEVIEEAISFNRSLDWDYDNLNVKLTTTAEELVDVFKLRSDVFRSIDYLDEFPDTIDGLNFDIYDKNSAIIYYKNNNQPSGTIRLIFDSKNKLPSEEKSCFISMRKEYGKIGKISRNVVLNEGKGLNLEFKYLMCGIYNIFINNDIDIALSGIKQEHLKLFKKLGGVEVIEELESYGTLDVPCYIISYNPNHASKFFKKVFLNQR